MTNSQIKKNAIDGFAKRATRDFKQITKENDIVVEAIRGTVYVFGSELATLRLFKHYNKVHRNTKTRQDYSQNRKTYYFSLDTNF